MEANLGYPWTEPGAQRQRRTAEPDGGGGSQIAPACPSCAPCLMLSTLVDKS
jgi:hypothetical protein